MSNIQKAIKLESNSSNSGNRNCQVLPAVCQHCVLTIFYMYWSASQSSCEVGIINFILQMMKLKSRKTEEEPKSHK